MKNKNVFQVFIFFFPFPLQTIFTKQPKLLFSKFVFFLNFDIFFSLFVCLSIYLFIYLSIYLSMHQSSRHFIVHPFVHPSIHPSLPVRNDQNGNEMTWVRIDHHIFISYPVDLGTKWPKWLRNDLGTKWSLLGTKWPKSRYEMIKVGTKWPGYEMTGNHLKYRYLFL